jgi:hypothetical protein
LTLNRMLTQINPEHSYTALIYMCFRKKLQLATISLSVPLSARKKQLFPTGIIFVTFHIWDI